LVEPSELEQEQYYHDQLIEHRIANFIGRKDKLKDIEKYAMLNLNLFILIVRYVKGTEKKPFVISGQAGSGKSAIIGYFAHQQKEKSPNYIYYHFVGASPNSTSIIHFLRRACQFLIKEMHLWLQFDGMSFFIYFFSFAH
jgi:ABC-type lipoprotein export system ATPase subunit